MFCDFLMEHLKSQVMISNKHLTTTDFTALGYFLENTSQPVSVSFFRCKIDNQGIKTLLSETEGKPLFVKYESEDVVLDSIKVFLMQQCSLKVLKLRKIVANPFEVQSKSAPHSLLSLDDFGFPDIINTSFANLEELEIETVQAGPRFLSSVLQHCEKLKTLI